MDNINLLPTFFMCANSADGLVTHFTDAYDPADGWTVFIIKGGPGTGKSTMMKRTAMHFARRGEAVELVTCTADPESLDAVIMPFKKVIIMDGTAPHVVEPRYIGACERIVDVTPAFAFEKLRDKREKIISVSDSSSAFHRRAARFLSAAGELLRENEWLASKATDTVRAAEFAEKFARENIPLSGEHGRESIRFLSGVTCRGFVFYKATFDKLCDRTVVISDNCGTVAPLIMSAVRREALRRGHDIITCPCPILPNERLDHIIIPALRLGFSTANKFLKWDDVKKTHTRRFLSAEIMRENKQRLSFGAHTARELMTSASILMAEAKLAHDELEKYYVSAVDFAVTDALTEKLIKDISAL